MNTCFSLSVDSGNVMHLPLNNGTAYIHLTSCKKLMLFMFELSFVYVLSLSSLSNPSFEIA
jgi:hypothetical protein